MLPISVCISFVHLALPCFKQYCLKFNVWEVELWTCRKGALCIHLCRSLLQLRVDMNFKRTWDSITSKAPQTLNHGSLPRQSAEGGPPFETRTANLAMSNHAPANPQPTVYSLWGLGYRVLRGSTTLRAIQGHSHLEVHFEVPYPVVIQGSRSYDIGDLGFWVLIFLGLGFRVWEFLRLR